MSDPGRGWRGAGLQRAVEGITMSRVVIAMIASYLHQSGPCRDQTEPPGLKQTTANSTTRRPARKGRARCGILVKAD